jgi:tetratricopeptide (TPR) repeat protein
MLRPDITKVYSLADFPAAKITPESAEAMVKKINTDYQYLRDKVDFSEYDIWVDIANTKLALSDYNGAIEAWTYATNLNPISPLAYGNLANYYKSFAKDYEKAEYYYQLVAQKDPIGYFFDYQAYAELYLSYLPRDPYKAELIMLDGVEKASPDRQIDYYAFLLNLWQEEKQVSKVDYYKEKILEINPGYQF